MDTVRGMGPPSRGFRNGYQAAATHVPQGQSANQFYYGHNPMVSWDSQLRLDVQQQQQQQRRLHGAGHYGYQQSYPVSGGYYTTASPTTPESPVVVVGVPSHGRTRASSRSSGSSGDDATSPTHDCGSSDIELDGSSNATAHAIQQASSGYAFPRYAPAVEDLCPGGALGNAGGEDLSRSADSQKGGPCKPAVPRESPGHDSRAKRRSGNQTADGQPRNRKSFKQETYVLRVLDEDCEAAAAAAAAARDVGSEDGVEEDDVIAEDEGAPLSTLAHGEYKEIFAALNEQFCRTAYRWLAQYRFRIPRKRYMKEHTGPFDRELTEYVQIIRSLVEGREVPRHAVSDERLNELVSVMEGASEIRHVNIHVSRKHKPDRRVLGFIAAVNEFCWILRDSKGAAATNHMYVRVENLILRNRSRLSQDRGKDSPRRATPE